MKQALNLLLGNVGNFDSGVTEENGPAYYTSVLFKVLFLDKDLEGPEERCCTCGVFSIKCSPNL